MKVALAGTDDHTALESLLPLLDIPQVPRCSFAGDLRELVSILNMFLLAASLVIPTTR
jgi:hypothetical protein